MKELTTAEITKKYVDEHPYIKNCLNKGLINYSSLSRLISKELKIEKKTSIEAILIALRRIQEKLNLETNNDKDIIKLLSKSELEVKTKICIYILEKNIDFSIIEKIQNYVKKDSGVFYFLEGSTSHTFILQEKFIDLIEKYFKLNIIKKNNNMVLINLKSSKDIENTPGVVSFLSSLFAENDINISEFISCWTDTIFIVNNKDLNKCLNILNFE